MKSSIAPKKMTPMVKQYLDIKEDYQDSILFFRMGDFYEMFFDDAVTASKLLGITLTSRNKNKADEIPLCGIPYHAAAGYISKLISKGHKVAICEQTEDPKQAIGIVKREVIKVVTPGLVMDESNLDEKSNNFIMSLYSDGGAFSFSYADISTGDVYVSEVDTLANLASEIFKIEPKEIVTTAAMKETLLGKEMGNTVNGALINTVDDVSLEYHNFESLLEGFDAGDINELVEKGFHASPKSLGMLIGYIKETQKGWTPSIGRLISYYVTDYMIVDESTRRNLELIRTMREMKKEGSLFGVLDYTMTSMGGRLLRSWINFPLIDIDKVNARLTAVSELKEDIRIQKELTEQLKEVYDVERLNSRLTGASSNARDLIALKNSVMKFPEIKTTLNDVTAARLVELNESLDLLDDVAILIHNAITDDPPITLKDGGLIKKGYNAELDELLDISRHGKNFIASLEAKERERTGINSLKIKFNKVFGYYIEVTKTHLDKVPEEGYIRKQTLVNAERFITEELKEYEDKVLSAEEKIVELEYHLFKQVRAKVASEQRRIKKSASVLANLDALLSLSKVAAGNNYCRPEVSAADELVIIDGRHPVIEQINQSERFVPNDTYLDCNENRFSIITGPNMAGKSTYMRQVALIVLMAQIGSFVPAREARVGVVDRIFTRVGASDNLAQGESTFMVEMKETAHILRNATQKSLIILDEIGRGTSTFDGLSIAWAVAEYILDKKKVGAKTLFATHYHELCDLKETRKDVKNYNIAIKEYNDSIIFLRKIVKGATNRSYGIQVAKLAGLPKELTKRAFEILKNIEKGEFNDVGMPKLAMSRSVAPEIDHRQLALFHAEKSEIEEEIMNLDLNILSPIEAMNVLYKLQKKLMG